MGTLIHNGDGLPLCEYSVAGRALPGQPESGDACIVTSSPVGVLIAVFDGLGHGTEAAVAAATGIATIADRAGASSAAQLIEACHEALRKTRGAVLAVAVLHHSLRSMTWAGIGNIEAAVVRETPEGKPAKVPLNNLGGVVGYRMPSPRPASVPLLADDLIVFGTDGIASSFVHSIDPAATTDGVVATSLERFAKPTDDALVLAVRWLDGKTSK